MSNTIQVSNISANTSEKDIRDFFSFCGKISSLSLNKSGEAQEAHITFEKESAAKTALLLDNTQLGSQAIQVTSGDAASHTGATSSTTQETEKDDELAQEDKPQYLAQGYKLGDHVLQRGIQLDNQHGISSRFTKALQDFDTKTGASTRASAIDQKYALSDKATKSGQQVWLGLSSYYERFTGTPTGQRIHGFYSSSEKQVKDIHNEAIRLAGLKDKSGQPVGEGIHEPQPVPGTEGKQTTCTCGGADGVCGCAPNKCSCSGCAKSNVSELGTTATGPADTVAASSNVAPLGEKQ
ncbi:MAG: hypothetical protein GOMPHAMPRED_003749 [Gomphillus americanus]|uniref:RRM domain-containing protein n=1 Tax=Gomphillus americanus TaxID=1940652 RepID=A0A8H3FK25_9LECA|nr:MAG: hypothetical protein GOMPHAMPRED_003749 [Gomphillus americanus]